MFNFPHHGSCFPSVLKIAENFLMSSLPAILPQYDRTLLWHSQTLLVFLVTLSLSWRKFLGINWLDFTVHFVSCWGFCNKIVTPQQGKKSVNSSHKEQSWDGDNKFLSCPSGFRTISPKMPSGQIVCIIYTWLGIMQIIIFSNFANNASSCPFPGRWKHL